MRLPYVPEDPQLPNPEDQAVVERVKARRGGRLIALDRALLHAPPVADGWNSFLSAIRTKTSLAPSIRELAISRVAALNKAWYEWDAHTPLLRETNVLSEDAIMYLKECGQSSEVGSPPARLFDERHAAVLEYTDAMTLGCVVGDKAFARLKALFSEREVVEITATVAAYNTVSRFLVALDVGEMREKYGVDMS